jgi:hypothetical protein
MFDTLFRYPAIVARHQGGRFAAARELFLNHCAGQGMAHTTLQRYAHELLVVAERIDITVGDAIESSAIEAAADYWARERHQRQRVGGLRWSRELFVQTATDWLRQYETAAIVSVVVRAVVELARSHVRRARMLAQVQGGSRDVSVQNQIFGTRSAD